MNQAALELPPEIWCSLLEGRWSLVARFDTQRRRVFVARENEPDVVPQRRLSSLERRVTNLLVTGASQKQIGYELGASGGTISKAAATARKKLGVRTCAELVELHATLVNS